MPQTTYPLILTHLHQVRCVVVGGGSVAERKVGDLLAGGAHPEVISPTLTAPLTNWQQTGAITHLARTYQPPDLVGAFLVIAATDDRSVNAAVAAEGQRLGMLVNVADDPDAGTFHTVGTVRRGDLLLTVSTGAASPALAAHLRRELEARYGEEYARLLDLLRRLRDSPARALARRARFWQQLPFDTLLAWLRDGTTERVEAWLDERIDEERQGDKETRRQEDKKTKT